MPSRDRDPRTDWVDLSVALVPAHSQVPPSQSSRDAEYLARDLPNMSLGFWAHHDLAEFLAGRMLISAN